MFSKSGSWGVIPLLLFLSFSEASIAQQMQKVEVKSDSGQSIPDTLLFKLQKAQAAITEINAANQKGYRSAEIKADLADISNDIAPIRADLHIAHKVLDPKTLVSYNLILNNSQQKLMGWQKSLTTASNNLQRMSKEVVALSNDSLLSVKAGDTTTKNLYTRQLIIIKYKLQDAGKANSASLDTVSRLLAAVSDVYLHVTALQANISDRLAASGRSVLGKESPYIWEAPSGSREEDIGQLLSSSYAGQQKIIGYFVGSNWDNRILLLLFAGLFYLWVHLNFRKIEKLEARRKINVPSFVYLTRYPILPALIVLFNVAPVFEVDAPPAYIELLQFLLICALTILFYKRLGKKEFGYWLAIVLLFLVIVLAGAAVHDELLTRLFLLVINSLSFYFGSRLARQLKSARISKRFVQPATLIYLALNALAILLNALGRISLAKIFSVTAIIGLTQIIGLAVFIQLFGSALELQIKVSASNGGLFSRISLNKTRVSFRRALALLCVLMWLLVFLINLSVAGGVFSFLHQVFVKPRSFGSVTFTFGNVFFFAAVLYVSNILQQHIGILFGERSVSFSDHKEHRGSKLTLLRLIIATVGVLLAVTASGIPLDKLTVVLGALSVGVGLGMQNIVNNFVSGIILIFEKPFQIGDFIELIDKKGKIQDIGIRSSKMLTQQGSQVIIPNADLITNRFVNWTVNSAYIQSELIFKVNIATDLNLVTKIVKEEVDKTRAGIKGMDAQLLVNAVAADAIELKLLVWIDSVYVEASFKSRLLASMVSRFAEQQIKLM